MGGRTCDLSSRTEIAFEVASVAAEEMIGPSPLSNISCPDCLDADLNWSVL